MTKCTAVGKFVGNHAYELVKIDLMDEGIYRRPDLRKRPRSAPKVGDTNNSLAADDANRRKRQVKLRLDRSTCQEVDRLADMEGFCRQDWLEAIITQAILLKTGKGLGKDCLEYLTLPDKGSLPLYSARENKLQSPIEFYQEHWKKYEDAGILFQDHLRHCDIGLLQAIASYCGYNKLDREDYVPPPKAKRKTRIAQLANLTAEQVAVFKTPNI